MLSNRKVYLEISTWIGLGLGGKHYYGELWCDGKKVELQDLLSEERAKKMDNGDGYSYRPGTLYPGFDTKDDVIQLALSTYRQHFPQADILILGRMAYGDPQHVLDGPQDFMETINRFYEESVEIGWYSGGQFDRMERIFDDCRRYVKTYGEVTNDENIIVS